MFNGTSFVLIKADSRVQHVLPEQENGGHRNVSRSFHGCHGAESYCATFSSCCSMLGNKELRYSKSMFFPFETCGAWMPCRQHSGSSRRTKLELSGLMRFPDVGQLFFGTWPNGELLTQQDVVKAGMFDVGESEVLH